MIYFTLPNFYTSNQLNKIIYNYSKDINNQHKFVVPVKFIGEKGNYPFCYHSGGLNHNSSPLARWQDFHTMCNSDSWIGMRLDCSSIFLNDDDFNDSLLNTILEVHETGSTYIELSNLKLMEYIEQKYPNYMFILSANADLLNKHTPEVINTMIESEKFHLISLPKCYNDNMEFLKAINHRNKLELTVNSLCHCDLEQCNKCIVKENETQYYYSGQSIISACPERYMYNAAKNTLISLNDIKQKYLPLGITHYALAEYPNTKQDMFHFIFFFADYFIKPEFREEVLFILLKEAGL